MTVNDVYNLREQGRIEEAYEAVRSLYAASKDPRTTLAMFWTAVDMLQKRIFEERHAEAEKIFLALERMLPYVPDKEGWVEVAFHRCQTLIGRNDSRNGSPADGPQHLKTGNWGEELAAAYLREKGYVILHRDWRSGHRDIDIIAQDGDTLVFVEVKTRHDRDFADPLQAINLEKRCNLRQAINHYLKYHTPDRPWRFDVITIIGAMGSMDPEITHIDNYELFDSPSVSFHKKKKKNW
jgi:uncharacterized protein (TIGR00252 family)